MTDKLRRMRENLLMALGLVKTELCNLVEVEDGMQLLTDTLVMEDFLVPEFLEWLAGFRIK